MYTSAPLHNINQIYKVKDVFEGSSSADIKACFHVVCATELTCFPVFVKFPVVAKVASEYISESGHSTCQPYLLSHTLPHTNYFISNMLCGLGHHIGYRAVSGGLYYKLQIGLLIICL